MILTLLADHSQNCSQLKGCSITSLVLWADICSPVLWEGGGQLQAWALACRCCPGTWQWTFSCPTLLRPGGLATNRGFSFVSPFWERIPLWQLAPGTVSLTSTLGDCQSAGEGCRTCSLFCPCKHNVLAPLGLLLPLPETQWGGTGGSCQMYSFWSASHQS